MTFTRRQAAEIIETGLAGDGSGRLYAVVGTPITHSLSPIMHRHAYEQLGLRRRFVALDPHDRAGLELWCDEVASDSRVGGFCVTIPYKTDVVKHCGILSPTAQRAGAVNTVTRLDSGVLSGDNTDVVGFIYALQAELGVDLTHSTCVLFGAGGVARAMVVGLIEAGVEHITIVARSIARANALVETMSWASGVTFKVSNELDDRAYDVAINATPLGLKETDELVVDPARLLKWGTPVYDAVYRGIGTTELVQTARDLGLGAADGRGMLAAQGARQALLWGVEADESKVRALMLEALKRQEEL